MKHYPAIDIGSSDETIYALLDDFSPTAIQERDDGVRAFFASAAARDAALAALRSKVTAVAIDVPDEDWARRSQADLKPVTVGLITVFPSPQFPDPSPQSPAATSDGISISIVPSTGFGTGHHATTRLCLEALQAVGVSGKSVLDVGTGSGLLAIAADRLGASRVVGIDNDPDAVESARSNLEINPPKSDVSLVVGDIYVWPDVFDVVASNLTGALLIRIADILHERTTSGGTLILSGFMREERDDVCAAFSSADIVWERAEDEWVAVVMKKP